ncbi:regulatory protein, luxR family [Actinokineospora alba]|uniref:Regulatory protein, luxR family n=1 Tax=Actinokineospora alba TaxID=504798 RepID=A0A1H0W264_9PSEU|nr:LuxR family transcriptional regulator [Actinokineospora alba]TDP67775.1 regulatory LuxR family protein [Actinokineospora alba]SDI71630.1 regulatory protein, luxR family [Actinokineospora alba]SDP84638.1 regulatory protein, luxR family [Actinokineospora alba]
MFLLEPVGLGQVESEAYLALLELGRADSDEVGGRISRPAAETTACLRRLVVAGLAFQIGFEPAQFTPVAPEVAVAALVDRRRGELTQLQVRIEELAARRRSVGTGTRNPVELVEGEGAVVAVLAKLQLEATDEVLIIDSPPYLGGQAGPNVIQLDRMAEGVAFRVVYSPESLATPTQVEQMHDCVRGGEQARILAGAKPKLVIADRRVAVLPVSFDPADAVRRLVIRSESMLAALCSHFEALWESAGPISLDIPDEDGVTARDKEMMALLAAGMKDIAIARTIGVTDRTVGRRVTELMRVLGAETRFQAGVLAARRGWL